MSSVLITTSASNTAYKRRDGFLSSLSAPQKRIPLLAWSERSYFDDYAGHRTEFGPQFYLSFTNEEEIDNNEYFTTETHHGGRLALAPGALFRSGSHMIDLRNGKLTLASSD
jgi:hypothetical protein